MSMDTQATAPHTSAMDEKKLCYICHRPVHDAMVEDMLTGEVSSISSITFGSFGDDKE